MPSIARVPVCAPQLARSELLTAPADLASAELIGIQQFPKLWTDFLAKHGAAPASAGEAVAFTSTVSALEGARRGLGVALALYPLVCAYPGYGTELVRVTSAVQPDVAPYRLVYRQVAADSEKVRRVRQWLREAFGDLLERYPLEALNPE